MKKVGKYFDVYIGNTASIYHTEQINYIEISFSSMCAKYETIQVMGNQRELTSDLLEEIATPHDFTTLCDWYECSVELFRAAI